MRFVLKGRISWDVGSLADNRYMDFEERIFAPNFKLAIKQAMADLERKRRVRTHLSDLGLQAELFVADSQSKLPAEKIWTTRWEPAQDYVPPRPAIPARKAGFVSKRLR